jgi:cysteine sulfinate desulfinase/cysteine desulfurase-like protein
MGKHRRPIYLDHLASTPMDPDVRTAMEPWLAVDAAGNPHSEHVMGWRAAGAVDDARASIARLIGAERSEIVFTSGATEANNIALFGLAGDVERIIVSAIEHPSVLEPAEVLRCRGLAVTVLPVGQDGRVDLSALAGALAEGRALVSIMAANNEIGTVQPLAEIGQMCRAHGAIFHTDVAQALSTQALDVNAMAIDLLSLRPQTLRAGRHRRPLRADRRVLPSADLWRRPTGRIAAGHRARGTQRRSWRGVPPRTGPPRGRRTADRRLARPFVCGVAHGVSRPAT